MIQWQEHPRRHGISAIFLIVFMVVLFAFASLAVDLGRVQLAKTELRQAADAAARYAAAGLSDGTWLKRAQNAAAENKADATSIALGAPDVVVGNWDATQTPHFSTSRSPTNAVQVTAQRTTASGKPIKLWFASLIGISSCDVRAVAVATAQPALISGFIGLNGFTVKNNVVSAGYDSSLNTNPSWATKTGPGMLGSNDFITAKNNEVVGQVILGKGATQNLALSNPPIQLDGPIPTPAIDFSGVPAGNPGGVSKNLHVTGTTVLPGGTYYFSSIKVDNNSDLMFSGPATLYIDGNVDFSQDNAVIAYKRIPSNLKIRQRGAGTFFGGKNTNNLTMIADVEGPQSDFSVKNNAILMGHAIFNTITIKNNGEFYYDQQLHASLDGGKSGTVTLVQ